MKEIDITEPYGLKAMLQYKINNKKDMEDMERELFQDYKQCLGDPIRVAAQYEKNQNIMKNVGKKKKIRDNERARRDHKEIVAMRR